MPTNGQTVLNMLLFDLRGVLVLLKGATDLVDRPQDPLPADVLAWFHKWTPTINAWVACEALARPYTYESFEVPPNWEQIITGLEECLQGVPAAHAEAQALDLTQREDVATLMDVALKSVNKLNHIYYLIHSGKYKEVYQPD